MRQAYRAGAGALGGLAAGLWLLSASALLAAEPAANEPLSSLGPDGKPAANFHTIAADQGRLKLTTVDLTDLKPMDVDGGRLKPLSAPTVRLVDYPGYAPLGGGGDPLTCLAQAVYFEARSESEAGQKAVAQVVMNRTRMPQYASTVCGVVYQGADRDTGCQFTFACNGSLREPDEPAAWDKALGVARNALSGYVYTPMLGATHYHAAWMTPYWAREYARIRRIGDQVFYH